MVIRRVYIFLVFIFMVSIPPVFGVGGDLKKVLILYENVPSPVSGGLGDARQLRQLLGHFQTEATLKAVSSYRDGEMAHYNFTFYIGYTKHDMPPNVFMHDAFETKKPLIWLNTGMETFTHQFDVERRFGFRYLRFDTTSVYDVVNRGDQSFTKTEPNANVIRIIAPKRCVVLATTTSTRTHTTVPYIVRSEKFWYVVDSPFSYATEGDRYLLFADMLHDILGEPHAESHSALIRIEDTNPFSDPTQLRDIADVLSDQDVPFLVGVTPFYVNPANGIRVAMSDKPDYVDALHYMMEHGGTIVLHGTTHQYKGETSVDYEYWDESRDRILPVDSKEYVEKKIRDGINECIKNGVYPLVWETPHYSASALDYSIFAEHFSTVVEQRLVLDRLDQSQYFPYLIYQDMYDQRIYPENLGYIPFDSDEKKSREAVDRLISYAKVNLSVRDGFASAFFHPFLDPDLLKQLIDGLQKLGYTFIDLRDSTNIVKLDDRVIVSGNASVALSLNERYLKEVTLNDEAKVVHSIVYPNRLKGTVRREVKLEPKWIYVGEATEYYERTLSFREKVKYQLTGFIQETIKTRKPHGPANVLLLYDTHARGGAYNDQSSMAAAFLTLNIPLETLAVTSETDINASAYNLVLVPYHVADLLSDNQIESLKTYVQQGGNLITDFRNTLAAELGIHFLDTTVQIDRVRDSLYPEEPLRWHRGEVMNKFEPMRYDEIMTTDDKTETPVVIGRRYGDGKFIFFGTRFDPMSTGGFSRYPYLIQYVEHFFSLHPFVRRDQLEVYFDPGFRHTVSVEQLVSHWVESGIRVIHVAGWHEYPKYTYDYARLIRLAHANGILVYAWLEPPQVSQKIWMEHPEWREKNYLGEDARPSWRYPVALTDPACLKAALTYCRNFLTMYDWDGVNIAELYFEAGRSLKDIKLMTPLHPSARSQFRETYGFDPLELFDPRSPYFWEGNRDALSCFTTYRVQTVTRLHDIMLSMADSIRRSKPGFLITVTVMDTISAPDLRTIHGIDVNEIFPLRAKYPFVLQVEDPESMWSLDPGRYVTISHRYAGRVSSNNFALDLNILSFRAPFAITPFPTRIQTGTESYRLVHSAARGAQRVTIYSESSMNPQDLVLLPYAYSARTKVKKVNDGWEISTPTPVVLQLASKTQEIWQDDKRVLTIGEGKFLLPIGSYHVRVPPPSLRPFQTDILETRILSITGDLLSEKSSKRSVEFQYRSENRCIVTLVKEPFALFVDGHETEFKALKGNGRYALMLPPGEHGVLIVAQSNVSYGVVLASFWSSSLLVVFGILSGGLLLLFYIFIRIRYRPR
jgi:uncharacterized protein YdaL